MSANLVPSIIIYLLVNLDTSSRDFPKEERDYTVTMMEKEMIKGRIFNDWGRKIRIYMILTKSCMPQIPTTTYQAGVIQK